MSEKEQKVLVVYYVNVGHWSDREKGLEEFKKTLPVLPDHCIVHTIPVTDQPTSVYTMPL